MKVTGSAVSLNVRDVAASADFLERNFGFTAEMSAPGFVSLSRDDVAFNVIFLATGLETFKPSSHAGAAGEGLLLVFVVDDIDEQWRRVTDAGLVVATAIETEPWGERYFQVLDPNGIVVQLVQWVDQ